MQYALYQIHVHNVLMVIIHHNQDLVHYVRALYLIVTDVQIAHFVINVKMVINFQISPLVRK